MELTDRGRAILEFERTWWQQPDSKESAIRERFGISTTRYYQLVAQLLEDSAAYRHDPLTVSRLRRQRERRRRVRLEGRRAGPEHR